MKAMLAGFAAMILISIGAYFALNSFGPSGQNGPANTNVRLSD